MQFIQGQQRHQTYFAASEDQVAADNPVRLIDAFIDKLDLQKLGFQKTIKNWQPDYSKIVCALKNVFIKMIYSQNK